MRLRDSVLLLLVLGGTPGLGGEDRSPALPDGVVDLRTSAGAALVGAQWRYTDAHIVGAQNRVPGGTGALAATHDVHPRMGTPDFEGAPWAAVAPEELEVRRTTGRLAFAWYRLDVTIPERVGGLATAGSTVVFEVVADDYAEVWVDGSLPMVLGQSGGAAIAGWNTPSRVVAARDARPGQVVQIAIFAANGPLSDPPANYVWIRSATLDFYAPGRLPLNTPVPVETTITRLDPSLDAIIAPGTRAERLADGFVFTEGPVWVPRVGDGRYGGGGRGGYLLFSDPNRNVIHRYDPATAQVAIFRVKSGYAGADMGEYHQPGSNGLALDSDGRLTICEHGNRRVTRLEPNGGITVLADAFEGRRLNSPNDLVHRSDGALYFTDPPFGLPRVFGDPRKELAHSGVYVLHEGRLSLAAADLDAPNGLALTPDERFLYVDNWQEDRKVVLRYDVASDGSLSNARVFFDMTSTPGEICLDGLKVDAAGNVYAAGPGGMWIISPAGVHLGTVALPELPANFAFGDDDGRTLYVCARTGLYRLRTLVPGAGR
jgi:gluconolactonase